MTEKYIMISNVIVGVLTLISLAMLLITSIVDERYFENCDYEGSSLLKNLY